MGSWKNIWRTRSKDWLYSQLDPQQIPGEGAREAIVAGQHYINVYLQSARVVDVRKGLSKFYGAVHSFVKVPHRTGEPAEFNSVVSPAALRDIDAKHLDRVIAFQHRLVGPVPYHGGDIELELGLFSVKSADLAGPYISLLEDISGMAGVSQLSVALPFAEPLKKGIDLLAGAEGDSILEIGISTGALKLETGFSIVMRAERNEVDATTLKLDPNDWRVLNDSGDSVSDYPYLVIKVEATKQRDAWFAIEDLKKPYKVLQEAIRRDDLDEVKAALGSFQRAARTCFDLLLDDALRISKLVEQETNKQMGKTLTSAADFRSLKELKDYELYP